MLLLFMVGCWPKKATVSAVDPVHFSSGSSQLAQQTDYIRIGQAVQQLQENSNLYLLVVGYSDPSGSAETNQRLSQARAEYVRSLVLEGGADGSRVLTKGAGETSDGSSVSESRRCEFVFYEGSKGAPPSADTVMASGSSGSSSADSSGDAVADASGSSGKSDKKSKSKKKKKKGDELPDLTLAKTGLTDIDSFFGKVQPLIDSLMSALTRVRDARTKLEEVLGMASGDTLDAALGEMLAQAPGAVKLKLVNGKPQLSVSASAPSQVGQGVTAVNGLVGALGGAVKDLAPIPNQAKALIAEAKALPAKVPNIAKEAGLSAGETLKAVKAVKDNVVVVTKIPTEVVKLGKEAAETFKVIQGAFA